MIKALLTDIDNTILDFNKCELEALKPVLIKYGIPTTEENIKLYSSINLAHWKMLEKKEISREECITLRWTSFFSHFNINVNPKDINELYTYLTNRGFTNYPKIIDSSRDEVNVFEYVEDIKLPKEQKCDDLIEIIASLHNKTSYFKEVSEDRFKSIYEDVLSNINYLSNYYNTLYEIGFNEVYASPSNYIFMRNYYKLNSALEYAKSELENWYSLVTSETKIRVCLIHNNLELNHLLNDKLISWDNYMIDTPVIDIVKLYKKEWKNINFSERKIYV